MVAPRSFIPRIRPGKTLSKLRSTSGAPPSQQMEDARGAWSLAVRTMIAGWGRDVSLGSWFGSTVSSAAGKNLLAKKSESNAKPASAGCSGVEPRGTNSTSDWYCHLSPLGTQLLVMYERRPSTYSIFLSLASKSFDSISNQFPTIEDSRLPSSSNSGSPHLLG